MMYLLQVCLYTGALCLVYIVCLKNKPLFALSRCYLILAGLLPFLLPLVQLPAAVQQHIQQAAVWQFTLPDVTVSLAGNGEVQHANSFSFLRAAYFSISLLMLMWQCRGVVKLWKAVGKKSGQRNGRYTLFTNTGYGPGSFCRVIFFPGAEVDSTILAHEQAHVSSRHSADIMLITLLQCVCWPNIFLYWLQKELKVVHEFEADAIAATDTDAYAQLLLCSAFGAGTISLMHSFINHPLKRRIMMLRKKKGTASPVKAMMQVTASLCMVAAAGMGLQGCGKNPAAPADAAKVHSLQPKHPIGTVYTYLDVMPKFLGDSLTSYLGHALTYPDYARKHGIEGRVIVKFVVGKDGAIMDPVILRSPDSTLSVAAIKAISKMPAWQPGRLANGEAANVYFTLPVTFKLQ